MSARDQSGNLLLGNCTAASLAAAYGTPLVVIELDVVDAAVNTFVRCATNFGAEVSYAAKAFATIEFLRHLAEQPIGIDVCSAGELVTAERAGFAAGRITLHGAGKSDEELTAACAGRLGRVVVDGLEELERLVFFSRDGCAAAIMLRLNVGIEAGSHAFVRTGGADTKFGIHLRDEVVAAALLRAHPQLRFVGLHAHIGSQVYETSAYTENACALMAAAHRFSGFGMSTSQIVIGGGFGVPSHPSAPEKLDLAATIAAVARCIDNAARDYGVPVPQFGIEPGRAIVALAGTTLYRVLAKKRQSRRTFVVVDGGIAENPRPALYGSHHHVVPATPLHERDEQVTLCGRSCENDELGNAELPRDVGVGALLAMRATGAYTYSMAGNYNRFPRPAVLGISNGFHRLLARRETLDDVLRNDLTG